MPVITLTYQMLKLWSGRVTKGEISRFSASGGKPLHNYFRTLSELFLKPDRTDSAAQVALSDLFCSYVHYSILGLLTPTSAFWGCEEQAHLRKLRDATSKLPEGALRSFSGLTLNPKDLSCSLDSASEHRCGSDGGILELFETAWGMYWISNAIAHL